MYVVIIFPCFALVLSLHGSIDKTSGPLLPPEPTSCPDSPSSHRIKLTWQSLRQEPESDRTCSAAGLSLGPKTPAHGGGKKSSSRFGEEEYIRQRRIRYRRRMHNPRPRQQRQCLPVLISCCFLHASVFVQSVTLIKYRSVQQQHILSTQLIPICYSFMNHDVIHIFHVFCVSITYIFIIFRKLLYVISVV